MVLEMNVDLLTQSLTEINLDPARKNRLPVMTELYDYGVSSREISNCVSEMELPTPTRT
jgi:hypothetical protein